MITTWSKGAADEHMAEDILVGVMEKVRRHPWWNARASLAAAAVMRWNILPPARIADVGCGWGTNLRVLQEKGYRVTGIDISRRVLELIDSAEQDLIEADLNQDLPQAVLGSFDACLVLDVIEHLDDDRSALARVAQLLRPNGMCIVSVPALPSLFSEFDRVQGHRRRYLPARLNAAFRETGLRVRSIFWWGSWMIPVLYLMRLRSGSSNGSNLRTYSDYLRIPHAPIPQLMALAYKVEKHLALFGCLPRGTSLFAVASRCE